MNHLTNLYKHKCEQLQEQINNLKKMLNESDMAPQNPPGYAPPFQTPSGQYQSPSPQSPIFPGIPAKPHTTKPTYPPSSAPPTSKPAPIGKNTPPSPYEIGSYGWETWVQGTGHWHAGNPYNDHFGSTEWFKWEAQHANGT